MDFEAARKSRSGATSMDILKKRSSFGCIISLLNKAAIEDTLTAPKNTELLLGWSKLGFAEMAKCRPAIWDSVLGSFKPIPTTNKADHAPPQFTEQFREMSTYDHGGKRQQTKQSRGTALEEAEESLKNNLDSQWRSA